MDEPRAGTNRWRNLVKFSLVTKSPLLSAIEEAAHEHDL